MDLSFNILIEKLNECQRLFLGVIARVFLSSCGIGNALITNHNQNATEVHLSENNFKVIDQVSGSAEVSYVLAMGGMDKRQLYDKAYSAMMKKANLLNSSKAIINVMTEEHVNGFFPYLSEELQR